MKTKQNEIYSPYQCLVVLNNHRSEVVHNLPATTNMCIMSNICLQLIPFFNFLFAGFCYVRATRQ